MNLLADLFYTFVKIGLFTFGGGYAMISVIENICVEKKHWITHDELMDITVLAESTPGPIAINCATFVGYRKRGIFGAVFATLGVILPSFLILSVIAAFMDHFLEIEIVKRAFFGIKIAVGILIVDAALKMIKSMQKTALSCSIVIGATVIMMTADVMAWHISSVVLMLFAGGISLMFFLLRKYTKKAGKQE